MKVGTVRRNGGREKIEKKRRFCACISPLICATLDFPIRRNGAALLMSKMIPPKSVFRLKKLWPHARKQGKEINQLWRVGYYSKKDGPEIIWLVDSQGDYRWTVDSAFLESHFEVVSLSKEGALYGERRPELGPL